MTEGHDELAGNIVPAGWKTMGDFAAGIDGNRLPATDALAGTKLRIADQRGQWSLAFASADSAVLTDVTGAEHAAWYEAVPVRADLHFLTVRPANGPRGADVLIVHGGTGRVLAINSRVAGQPVPGQPRVSQEFWPGGLADGEVTGAEPGPTRDLIGLRALYRYSPNHLYEHVYLSSERYAWQCLVGEQRGHGDVDLASTWKIASQLYVFTFREFAIPVAATWLYDLNAGRTVGTFVGLSGDGQIMVAPGGALITQLGRVEYPDEQPV